jgi:hypothetical protein
MPNGWATSMKRQRRWASTSRAEIKLRWALTACRNCHTVKKSGAMMTKIEYKVGQAIEVNGAAATIVKVWPFGTVDVKLPNGKYARVTGLRVYA